MSYVTVQRTQLINFMEKHKDRFMSASEIFNGMKNDICSTVILAKSTLYRLLDHLAEENIIQREVKKGSRQYVFRIMDDEACAEHLHMTCVDCGSLVHIDHEQSLEIQACLKKSDLELEESSMLFGHCDKCRKEKNEK